MGGQEELICYSLSQSYDIARAPSCGVDRDGNAKCVASQKYKPPLVVTTSSYVVAIACHDGNSDASPSNRTVLWVEVMPALVPNSTGIKGGGSDTKGDDINGGNEG